MTTSQTKMTTSQNPKITSPTLHLYHYVLRNGLNDTSDQLEKRREFLSKNLHELASDLPSKSGKNATDFVRLKQENSDLSPSDGLLDFAQVPDESKKANGVIQLEDGIQTSRIAVRRLHDTYLLRFTRYISNKHDEQSLEIFGNIANIADHLGNLKIELGQTAILAGIIPETAYYDSESTQQKENIRAIAGKCLQQYFGQDKNINTDQIIIDSFLDSPFCIYVETVPSQIPGKEQISEKLGIESLHLTAVFLYKDPATETKANKFYNLLQDMLLSYHKIYFFYSQSRVLKNILSQQYENIERLTEAYAQQPNWDKTKLKELPQQSLEYYKKLSFLNDQANTIDINLRNYRNGLQEIERQLQQQLPNFFTEQAQNAEYYLNQIQTNSKFLSPGINFYEKLMVSVQTQVSIDDELLQTEQNEQQQKLGQLLTGSCAAIAIGQILAPAITASISKHYIDKEHPESISISSLWVGAFLTIFLSILSGWLASQWVYRWFTKAHQEKKPGFLGFIQRQNPVSPPTPLPTSQSNPVKLDSPTPALHPGDNDPPPVKK